jgi:endo-1,4-beta-xylanase
MARYLVLTLVCVLGFPAAAPAGDEIFAGAEERILKHRRGELSIVVLDAEGKPVPGAKVAVEQQRHEFLFGCNIFMFDRLGNEKDNALYKERFHALFNFATVPLYWASFEHQRGKPEYERIEKMARWCREVGIAVKGHPLVWNIDASSPRWLPRDPAEVRKLSDERVKACVERFKGLVDMFDVVNEAADPFRGSQFDTAMTDAIRAAGVEEFTRAPFRIARAANPNALFLINDYRTDPAYEKVIQFLTVDGTRLYDIIGIQSHMHAGVWPSRTIWEICERFAKYNVPLHYTETTVVSGQHQLMRWGKTTPDGEAKQAAEGLRFYTILFSHPAVEAITWWDFCDRGAWQGAPAGFLRDDLSPKPFYEALLKKVKGAWWTRAEGTTSSDGKWSTPAFYGDHRITVTTPGKAPAEASTKLSRKQGSATCTITVK